MCVTNWLSISNFAILSKLDEAGPGIALIAHEEKSGVILHALAPRRPTLAGKIYPVIVRVGPPQDLRAIIARGGGKTHMRVFGNDRVVVLIGRIQVNRSNSPFKPNGAQEYLCRPKVCS